MQRRTATIASIGLVALVSVVGVLLYVEREPADVKWNYAKLQVEGFANVIRRVHEAGVDIGELKSIDELLDVAYEKTGMLDFQGSRKQMLIDEWGQPLLWFSAKTNGMSIIIVSSQGRVRAESEVLNSPALRAVAESDGELVTEVLSTWKAN
jgi:hypothetical protein